jgi:hypothetical protein
MVSKPKVKAKSKANRQFKNSMFTMLFGDAKSAVELVNAFLGTDYGADAAIEIATLKNVLSCGRLNDLAVVLDNTLLVLIEHQSTVNKNMAYRMLEYVTEIYKRRVKNRDVYGTAQIQLPRPVFVVLYNGTSKTPAKELQRLSDLYSRPLPALSDVGGLELEATVINVNDRSNKSLVKTCKLFHEYCIFVDKLRRYRKTMGFDDAFNRAVDECVARGILKAFLQKHRKELSTMLLEEWNWDMALKVAKEENFEKGMEKGLKKGLGLGVKKGLEKGMGLGVKKGLKKGLGLGVKKGVEKGIGLGVKNTARNMKKEGMDAKTISRITGLSVYAIRRL